MDHGLNCHVRENYFDPSCAKLFHNIILYNDNTVQCCHNYSASDKGNLLEVESFIVLKELADGDNKINLRLVNYIVQQKIF